MTERDLYVSCIPMIAEMVVRCRKLSGGEYEEWKRETMEYCPEAVKRFMGKVMIVIDKYVLERESDKKGGITKHMQAVEQVIDSREVAEMVGKEHKNLVRDIRKYCEQLGELKIERSDFFTESTYVTEQNKTMPCFMVTKKGCEFIAHKLTGVKGTEFTARYINRFHEMEEQLLKENHMDWFVNDIRVFQHREFGILRTLKLDGQDYFVGIDVTRSLGYVNNTDTLRKRVSESEKCYVGICDGNRCRKMIVITVNGLNELIQTGRLPLNRKYNNWIQNQVLPALGAGSSLLEGSGDNAVLPEVIQEKGPDKEFFDMAPVFRELITDLPLDALDAMEKSFREDRNPVVKQAVASILAEKMKRQFA